MDRKGRSLTTYCNSQYCGSDRVKLLVEYGKWTCMLFETMLRGNQLTPLGDMSIKEIVSRYRKEKQVASVDDSKALIGEKREDRRDCIHAAKLQSRSS